VASERRLQGVNVLPHVLMIGAAFYRESLLLGPARLVGCQRWRIRGPSIVPLRRILGRLLNGPDSIFWRGIKDVDRQFEGIIYHPWQELFQDRGSLLQTWICIDLNQPRSQQLIDHEVVAVYFEAVLFGIRIELAINTFKRGFYDRHDIIVQDLVEIYFSASLFLQNVAGLLERELVALLELAVVLIELLDRVVCQVDEGLVDGFLGQGEFMGARPDVALLEQVAFLV
jgi:hypothetical protein